MMPCSPPLTVGRSVGAACLLEGIGLEDLEPVDVKNSDGRLARAAADGLVEALHQPAEGARVECLAQ